MTATQKTFARSAGFATLLTLAAAMLNATLPESGSRPLAPSTGAAMLGACEVTGTIASSNALAFVQLSITNPGTTPAAVDLYYTVQFTPPSSPFMRMLPVPINLTNGHFTATLAEGACHQERIQLVIPISNPPDGPPETEASAPRPDPARWALIASVSPDHHGIAWGALSPSPTPGVRRLEQGPVVLAVSASQAP